MTASGKPLEIEKFTLRHSDEGFVSMTSFNGLRFGSTFNISLDEADNLDKEHIVFGKVLKGMETVRTIGDLDIDFHDFPKKDVIIIDCGVAELDKEFEIDVE